MRRFALMPLAALAVATSAGAPAQAGNAASYTLVLNVPVVCRVHHLGVATSLGQGFSLGEISEYCNSPNGYLLRVSYMPGTLRGTRLTIGDSSILLDGSGMAEVNGAAGPTARVRPLTAVPGPGGFDSGQLNFDVQPL